MSDKSLMPTYPGGRGVRGHDIFLTHGDFYSSPCGVGKINITLNVVFIVLNRVYTCRLDNLQSLMLVLSTPLVN